MKDKFCFSYFTLNKFLSQIPVHTKLKSDGLIVGEGSVGVGMREAHQLPSLMLVARSIFSRFRHLENCNWD